MKAGFSVLEVVAIGADRGRAAKQAAAGIAVYAAEVRVLRVALRCVAGRSVGSRPTLLCKWMISMNSSACRRSSSATIGGCDVMVETTVTRTPRRCIASIRRAEVSVAGK